MADVDDLDTLSAKELHDRAIKLAVHRGDVKFLWRLMSEIPAAQAATGDLERSNSDLLHISALLSDFALAGDGKVAEALRPIYTGYLTEHSRNPTP
ncbi:MAG: hypothetical protein QOE54_5238 [Streptosporangiaceae bacterium]|jgi:hypothetical protein|nr:hypothetical protein [Streptosporangiaceae bacterium]MDX6432872.1 hypothetical protein [Streptosporangiaceae bacterium]